MESYLSFFLLPRGPLMLNHFNMLVRREKKKNWVRKPSGNLRPLGFCPQDRISGVLVELFFLAPLSGQSSVYLGPYIQAKQLFWSFIKPLFNFSSFILFYFIFFLAKERCGGSSEEALTASSRVLSLFLLCSKRRQTAREFLFWKDCCSFAPTELKT